jgi:surface antigen
MYKPLAKLSLCVGVVLLAGCSLWGKPSVQPSSSAQPAAPVQSNIDGTTIDKNTGQPVALGAGMSSGGALVTDSVEKIMSDEDKIKLSRALDGAPGKTTTWQNYSTGYTYAVTPTKKITVDKNPFCREYILMVSRSGNQRDVSGKACITADGNWHTI